MNTTIVKIDAADKDITAQMIAERNIECKFYTIEQVPGMLQCEIFTTDPGIMWHLGKIVGMKVTEEIFIKNRI